ncbi:MAG: hypothetical protein LBS81_05860 [Endomicrobium sp.]|nr:hypothetical protein [Endomicrobium sp.]
MKVALLATAVSFSLSFTNNEARSSGGVIYTKDSSGITFSSSTIILSLKI